MPVSYIVQVEDFEPLVDALTVNVPAVIGSVVAIIAIVGVLNWVLRKVRSNVR